MSQFSAINCKINAGPCGCICVSSHRCLCLAIAVGQLYCYVINPYFLAVDKPLVGGFIARPSQSAPIIARQGLAGAGRGDKLII